MPLELLDEKNFDFIVRDDNFPYAKTEFVSSLGLMVILFIKKGSATITANKNDKYELEENDFLFLREGTENVTYHFFGNPSHSSLSFGFRVFPEAHIYEYPSQIIKFDEELKNLALDVPFGVKKSSEQIFKFYHFLTIFKNFLVLHNTKNSERIKKVLDYMMQYDVYDVDELSKLCNLSREHFHTIFKEVTGKTPIQEKQRIQAAKAEILLRTTDMYIEDIAKKVGFSSVRHFRKVFENRYNCTPKQFQIKSRKL